MSIGRIDGTKLEVAGKDMVSFAGFFFILFKTAKFVEPTNDTFRAQSARFYQKFQQLTSNHEEIEIKVIEGRLIVQNQLIKFDSDGLLNAGEVLENWRRVGIGGVILSKKLDSRQIDKFIYLLSNISRDYHTREEIVERLCDLGIDGIQLLAAKSEEDKDAVPEELRNKFRQLARVSFFRAINVVEEAMLAASREKHIDLIKTRRVVHSLIDRIVQDESSILELTQIRDFDEYTYVHSVNVSIYSLTMGVRLGFDKKRLSQLGFSALFHDIGKIRLPQDLIQKPEVYDENDWIQMQKHPVLGAKTILRQFRYDEHTARAALVAFEHHINNDYSGYPVMMRVRPTNLFSRIIAIADVFDALHSRRVYFRKSIPPDEILRKMMYQIGSKYDAFLLKLFVNIIGIFPPGTLVLTSDNELAIVARNNWTDPARPLLRIIGDQTGPYERYPNLDLSQKENLDKTIVKIIDPGRFNIDIKSLILSDK